MIKKLHYEHIDTGNPMEVRIEILFENEHWAAKILGEKEHPELRTPVFYGETQQQAERQLRKVFEKDHDLIEEIVEQA